MGSSQKGDLPLKFGTTTKMVSLVTTALLFTVGSVSSHHAFSSSLNPVEEQAPVSSVTKIDPSRNLVKSIMQAAKKGKVVDCEFAIGDKKSDVIKKWGNPDYSSFSGPDLEHGYYDHQHISFDAYTDEIFMLTSYSPKVQKLTLSEVKKALGDPYNQYNYDGHRMMLYDLRDRTEERIMVTFQFLIPTEKNTNPHVFAVVVGAE
jgi:hypothetical protein